jgi:hypothetical protein
LIGIIAGQAHTGLSCTVEGTRLIILGIVLFVVGTMAGIAILKTIGVLQLVIGVILWVLGSMGPGLWTWSDISCVVRSGF